MGARPLRFLSALLVPLAAGCHGLPTAPLWLASSESTVAAYYPSLPLTAATAADEAATIPAPSEFEPCPGIGAGGGFVRAIFPAADELGSGLGVGRCSYVSLLLIMRGEYMVWIVGNTDTGDWGGMGEFSISFAGHRRWPVYVSAGAGLAIPLWDAGELDLNATWLCYAGAVLFVERRGGRDYSLSTRYTWHSQEATLGGQPVELDGWSVAFSWYF